MIFFDKVIVTQDTLFQEYPIVIIYIPFVYTKNKQYKKLAYILSHMQLLTVYFHSVGHMIEAKQNSKEIWPKTYSSFQVLPSLNRFPVTLVLGFGGLCLEPQFRD